MKQQYLVIPKHPRVERDKNTNADGHYEYAWAPITNDAYARWQHGNLDALIESVTDNPLLVVGEIEDFRFVTKPIPGKSRQQLLLAARYSLEDDIASDIDDVDIFVSGQSANGEYTIAIVESERLREILGPLAEKGAQIAELIPDAFLLDVGDEAIILLIDDERALIKYGPKHATAVELPAISLILTRLSRDDNAKGIVCHIPQASDIDRQLVDEIKQSLAGISFKVQDSTHSAADILLRGALGNPQPLGDLKLVPEKYQKQTNKPRRKLLWQIAAGLFALAVMTQLGSDWWHIERAETALATTRQAQQDVVKNSFPDIGRVVNAEAQVKRSLEALEKLGPPPAEFLTVLSQSLDMPLRRELGIEILGLTFADGVLLLRTESSEMGHLEEFRAGLNDYLSAEVVSAEASDNVVRGAIRITAK